MIGAGESGEKLKFSGDSTEEEVVVVVPSMVDRRQGRERDETRFPSSVASYSPHFTVGMML